MAVDVIPFVDVDNLAGLGASFFQADRLGGCILGIGDRGSEGRERQEKGRKIRQFHDEDRSVVDANQLMGRGVLLGVVF